MRFKRRSDNTHKCDPSAVRSLAEKTGIPLFVAQILVSRGFSDPESAERFLKPSIERDWSNPYEIAGMDAAVDKLSDAIRNGKRIAVFGDFDLDGISATTVMTRALRELGADVRPFIPHRFDEGYGMTQKSIGRLLEESPDLVVTVDCGISCKEEVESLVGRGIDVVITDHHEASQSVPDAPGVPVVDPKAEEANPASVLAGVGVALKVVCALGSRFGRPYLWREYTDFATLGTVADLMPMLGDNRPLVADGLRRMNEAPRPSIKALIDICGLEGKEITSGNLGFTLGPRLNAAGRMGNAEAALDLLMCDDPEESRMLSARLDELNTMRRQIESELGALAAEKVQEEYAGERVIVVAGEDWHEGVKGIVASRLAKDFKVPALLFTIEGDEARGSGRTFGDIDLFQAVESCSDILTRFGGHSAAVGLTVPTRRLDELRRRLDEYMAALPEARFDPVLEYDAVVPLGELTMENVGLLQMMAPFGQKNPEPVLLAHNVSLSRCRAVGSSKNHMSFTITDGTADVSAIFFHCPDIDSLSCSDSVSDALFTAQIDEWRGRYSVKAVVEALEASSSCAALESMAVGENASFIEGIFSSGGGPSESAGTEASSAQPGTETTGEPEGGGVQARHAWESLAREDPAMLRDRVIESIIGGASPHAAQRRMMDLLDDGTSLLGIMATGRGKSMVFQTHAAMRALRDGMASIFVYPLRALMSDQAFHITSKLEHFGLVCRVLNGETPAESREDTYRGIAEGWVDIVLTTPEYLSFHAERIAESGRIGFMVVDEAHHIGQSRAGIRPAYRKLGEAASRMGSPTVLALTATADRRIAAEISDVMSLLDRVEDGSSRDNLHIVDKRNIGSKDDYVAHVVSSGEKSIVYVNSREQSVGIARRLRSKVPALGMMIGFYNAGLSRKERKRIEALFRSGVIRTLVATSAFGEGIDIPDVRHVFLYHLPFSAVEFNQMSGRAGRDGNGSWIHLLYGRRDVSVNQSMLSPMAPGRDRMAYIYRRIKDLCRSKGGSVASDEQDALLGMMNERGGSITERELECALSVFEELGLIEMDGLAGEGMPEACAKRRISVNEDAPKVELTDSVRYREGIDEIDEFSDFKEWAMGADASTLRNRIINPIMPEDD